MRKQKRKRDQKGAAAVEFAIILPVFVLLLFGMIEWGILLFNQQVITNASREGARAGIVVGSPRLTDNEIQAVVNAYLGNHLVTFGAASAPNIQITPPGDRNSLVYGDDLRVTVTYNYGFLVLSNFGFSNRILTADSLMKME
jgi:Flp pilus assembly protein TadG